MDATNLDSVSAARALAWLAAERAWFLPSHQRTLRQVDVKAVSELALLLTSLRRQGFALSGSQRVAVELLTDTMEAASVRSVCSTRVIASPADVVFHAILASALASRGQTSARHRQLVGRAIAAGALDHTERVPHLLMEERMVLDWLKVQHHLPSWEGLIASSMLGRPLRAVRLNERTAYQLTHDIMFVAGFDRVPAAALALLDRSNLRTVLSDLIVRFAGEQHWDLVGEFLLCWDCLQLPHDDGLHGKAWRLLLAQQSGDGSFHGPPQTAKGSDGPGGGANLFARRYHPTLVAIMALAARHRRQQHRVQAPAGIIADASHPTVRPPASEAIRADAAWLQHHLPTSPEVVKTAAVACGVLVGTWLCAAMDPSLIPSYVSTAERTAELLAATDEPAVMPAGLMLTAHALLAQRGLAARQLTGFADAARSALDHYRPEAATDDVWLCEKRLILHQLRLGVPPTRVSAAELCRTIRSLPVRASLDELRLAAVTAESTSGHGTVVVPPSAELADAARQLMAHASRRFVACDLATACLLVRAAHHLVPLSGQSVADLTAEILLHQRSEGGYGLVEIEPGETPGVFNADADLHLPLTLTCLWTLAELSTDFRLYRSLATGNAIPTRAIPTRAVEPAWH